MNGLLGLDLTMNQQLAPCQFRTLHRRAFSGDATQMPPFALKGFEVLERAIKSINCAKDNWYNPTPEKLTALEIGIYKGGTTRWLLEKGFSVEAVDSGKGCEEHEWKAVEQVEAIKELGEYHEKLKVKWLTSETYFQCSGFGHFHLAIVDASHHSSDCLRDCIGCFDRLLIGGVLVIDDYLWNYHEDPRRNPKLAVDSFLACFHNQIEIIEMGYMVVARKTEKRPYDDLLEFAGWYVNAFGIPFGRGQILEVERVAEFVGHALFREDRNQVQLWSAPPNTEITPHSHPNIDQIFLYLGGDIEFFLAGEPVKFDVNLRPASSPENGALGLGFRTKPGVEHSAKFGERGGSFLTIQQWLDGPPRKTQMDWEGEPLDGFHRQELIATKAAKEGRKVNWLEEMEKRHPIDAKSK